MSNVLANCASWVGLFGGLIGIFVVIAPKSPGKPKERQLHSNNISNAIEITGLRLFYLSEIAQDRFFGSKILSSRAFFRSILASTMIVSFLYTYNRLSSGRSLFDISIIDNLHITVLFILTSIALDMVSVAETRILFRWCKNKNVIVVFFAVFFDYLISTFLSPIVFLPILILGFHYITGSIEVSTIFQNTILDHFVYLVVLFLVPVLLLFLYICDLGLNCDVYTSGGPFEGGFVSSLDGIYLAFVLSSFFTSIWIWLHVIGSLLMRLLFLLSHFSSFSFRHAERHDWYLMAPVILALAAICLAGLPFVAILSL